MIFMEIGNIFYSYTKSLFQDNTRLVMTLNQDYNTSDLYLMLPETSPGWPIKFEFWISNEYFIFGQSLLDILNRKEYGLSTIQI